ncbi:MAG: hypothetical protein LC779_13920 [Actinobacteria bacterium]|nr:hypothetical protein [Actinomycetota bacterium]
MDLVTPVATALADRPVSVPSSRRAGSRPVPQRSDDFTALTLEGLRDYRRTLTTEEAKVSYWRRIIQARLDTVRAGTLGDADGAHLRPVLTDARINGSRKALLDVLPVDDVPPLPRLAELWERRVDDGDLAGIARLEADLADAEKQISAYRKALHQRISDATNELIARYHETPTLCLSVLPLRPERRASA